MPFLVAFFAALAGGKVPLVLTVIILIFCGLVWLVVVIIRALIHAARAADAAATVPVPEMRQAPLWRGASRMSEILEDRERHPPPQPHWHIP